MFFFILFLDFFFFSKNKMPKHTTTSESDTNNIGGGDEYLGIACDVLTARQYVHSWGRPISLVFMSGTVRGWRLLVECVFALPPFKASLTRKKIKNKK